MQRARALLLALALCGCGQSPTVDAHPALWRLRDHDTTIWLFGSIHALPPGVRWRTPAVEQAIGTADTLILEVPPADPAAAHAAFVALATAPGLPPLRDRVAPADRAVVARGMAMAGQSPEALDGQKTWAAALTITTGAGSRRGATGANGMEPALAEAFAGKAIGALETQAGQLTMFDRLPVAAQATLLVEAARATLAPERDDATTAAWMRGDAVALAATLAPLRSPALAGPLIDARNRRWAAVVARRMQRPGRVLVAVGAGHLVGAGSVVALLRGQGWRVERIE